MSIQPTDIGLSGSSSLMRRRGHVLRAEDRGHPSQRFVQSASAFPRLPQHQHVDIQPRATGLLNDSRLAAPVDRNVPESRSLQAGRRTVTPRRPFEGTFAPAKPSAGEDMGLKMRLYQPLPSSPGSIRLLKVLRGSPQSPLRCDLMIADFHDATYETASYCSGRTSATTSIEIDGIAVMITSNAAQALHRLKKSYQDRVLWIDSACMLQEDIDERNQQVAKMHKIYSHGVRNLIWLGPDHGTVSSALESIQAITDDIIAETDNFSTFERTLRSSSGQLRLSSIPLTFALNLEPVLRLFARPWFSRMWVVQEASLSLSNRCFCGPHELDLSKLLRAAQWLYHKQAVLPTYTAAYESLNDYVVNAALLANFYDPDFGWFKKASTSTRPQGVLFSLLDNLARFETRNPRDRIFGLLGLYHHLAKPVQPEPLLRIDYEKSIIDVFRDATTHLIYELGCLTPVSWVQHRMTSYGVLLHPTWVPSWHRKWDGKSDASILSTFFNASLGHPIDIRRTKDPSKLRVTGLFIDAQRSSVVNDLTDVCLDSGALPQFFHQALSLWQSLTDNENPDTTSFATTLIAGQDCQNQAATSEILEGFRDFQRHLQTSTRPPRRRRSLTEQPVTLSPHRHTPMCRYREACWNACHRRRFFTTKGGRFGIGPQVMQTGDVVVVLYGGQWPFVLRPIDGSKAYELVGQCHVHGVMFGEAVERHGARGNEYVVFDIL